MRQGAFLSVSDFAFVIFGKTQFHDLIQNWIYTDFQFELKERELTELQQRFQDFQQIAQQDMQKKEAEVMTPIYDKANEAVKKVASAGGYVAVFSTAGDQPGSAGLAYFDPAALTDITADVKKELGVVDAQ